MTYAEDYVKRLREIQAANIMGQVTNQPVSKSEFANLILQKARSDWSYKAPPGAPNDKGKNLGQHLKSVGLGILDILSRPSYAVNEAADVGFNEGGGIGDILKGAGRGFTGKEKTSYIDVLQRQYETDVKESPEYKDAVAKYGEASANNIFASDIEAANRDPKAILGGLLVDFTLDPINAIGAGLITKPLQAIKAGSKISKAATESAEVEGAVEELARQVPTSAAPEGAQEAIPMPAGPGLSQDLIDKLSQAKRSDSTVQDFPRVTGKFASNRRPPVKNIEGEQVKADYSQDFLGALRDNPRFANLTDVFNRDLRESDFQDLQKARIQNETAQVVDQVAKGGEAATDLITNKNINPLAPVARTSVDNAVNHIVREISEAIPNPVKARAAGKLPRHPVFNAPTQNNLSNMLTNEARKQLIKESTNLRTGSKINKAAAPALIPAVFDRYIDMLKNAEESLISKGRIEKNDAFYPRGGIKPGSPYLRLSDVLTAIPREIAQNAILGTKGKVHAATILKAITGSNAALGQIAKQNKELFRAISNTDWTPLMVKEYATRTIDAANAAQETTDDVAKFIASKFMDTTASDVNKAHVMDETVKAAKKEFRNEMPEAKSSLGEMLDGLRKSIPNPTPDPVDDIIDRGKQKLAKAVFDSNAQKAAQAPRIATATAVTEEAIESPITDAAVDLYKAEMAAENGIFSTVLKWFDPASGYKDLRQLVLKNLSARKTSATTRAKFIIGIFSKVPEAEHLALWNEVIGAIPATPEHRQSVADLQKLLQNLFGDSGLADKFAGNTAIARAGINVDHLNKHMRIVGIKDFQFTRDVPDPLNPKKMIRLNPEQVLDTWKNYKPKSSEDLRRFVFNMSQAVENSMVEYSTFANLGALWGSKAAKNGMVQVTGMHSAIDGMYFPKEIVPQIGRMALGIDEMYEPVANSSLMRLYDDALRTWKTGVTIYSPSHHIRNMIGDVFTGWLDGLSNPVYYSRSGQMLMANYHRYSDIEVGKNPLADILGEGVETDLVGKIINQGNTKRVPKGSRVIATAKIGGKKFPITIDQAYQMAFRHGIFPHSAVIEDLPGSETLMESLAQRFHPGKVGPFAPAKGNIAKTVKGASETREHYVRGAHWLYALENTKAGSLEELFQKAGERVRKYHPDGLDLTLTEKKVMRRLIPFYSWNRKAIPLILEGIAMHPAKILAYPKIMSAMQEQQGIESSVSDPWPDDQLFPNWLSSNVIGPMLPPDNGFARAIARSPQEVGYTLINPGNPATDIMDDYFNNPVKGVANSFTPFIKIPAEVATGHEVQSGAPIDDKTEYIDKNVPLLSIVSRLTHGGVGTGLVEGGDLKGKETSAGNLPGLINFLTAAGILDTGRYIKGGEFDLKERLRKEKENGSK